ncbi:MAG: hypothetical protein IT548_16425 [Alphaproteobacteria bacterium]|nr:hypothetical protein [Alphaproteobacteria bacterium]
MKRMVLVMASVLAVMPASAAQALDFGGWCAEVAHFSPDRCLEGQAEDKMAYDRYLKAIHLYDNEKIRKQNSRKIEADRVNRMGVVTSDQRPTEGAADPR